MIIKATVKSSQLGTQQAPAPRNRLTHRQLRSWPQDGTVALLSYFTTHDPCARMFFILRRQPPQSSPVSSQYY